MVVLVALAVAVVLAVVVVFVVAAGTLSLLRDPCPHMHSLDSWIGQPAKTTSFCGTGTAKLTHSRWPELCLQAVMNPRPRKP